MPRELRLAALPRLNYIDAVEGSLGRHRCYTIEPIDGSDTPDLAPNPDGKSRTPATGRVMSDRPDPTAGFRPAQGQIHPVR